MFPTYSLDVKRFLLYVKINPDYDQVMQQDQLDEIVAQWARQRPAVDVSGMEIIGRIGRLNKVVRPQLDIVFARHDLESWEFDVLATLLRTGEPHRLTPGELLDSMMITSGAMTNRIDRLERRGFVERMKNPDDLRQVLVTLTPEGMRTVDAALVDHAENEKTIVSVLSAKQQEKLIKLLRTLEQGATSDTSK